MKKTWRWGLGIGSALLVFTGLEFFHSQMHVLRCHEWASSAERALVASPTDEALINLPYVKALGSKVEINLRKISSASILFTHGETTGAIVKLRELKLQANTITTSLTELITRYEALNPSSHSKEKQIEISPELSETLGSLKTQINTQFTELIKSQLIPVGCAH